MFVAPDSINSIISPVNSHPSPHWLPIDAIEEASKAVFSIYEGSLNLFESRKAFLIGFLNHSTNAIAN